VSQKPTGESCGAWWAVTTPAEASGSALRKVRRVDIHPAVSVAEEEEAFDLACGSAL